MREQSVLKLSLICFSRRHRRGAARLHGHRCRGRNHRQMAIDSGDSAVRDFAHIPRRCKRSDLLLL